MKLHTPVSAFIIALTAGCAAAPAPTAKAPVAAELAPADVSGAPVAAEAPPPPDGDIEFTMAAPKAKEPRPDVSQVTTLKADSKATTDMKTQHIHAAH